MPYFRSYQLPSTLPQRAARSPQQVEKSPMLNVTPSSNLIQETFRYLDFTVDPKFGNCIVIGKATRSSLYQRIIGMQLRAELFSLIFTVSEPIPTGPFIQKLTREAEGDPVRLDRLIKRWEAETIERYSGAALGDFITSVSEDAVYLNYDRIFQTDELSSIKVTVFSPDMPTKGDLPITAILYSPIVLKDGEAVSPIDGIKTPIGEIGGLTGMEIPFTWTDRSGFTSTIMILPNVIYPIQPVSIRLDYEITLLA